MPASLKLLTKRVALDILVTGAFLVFVPILPLIGRSWFGGFGFLPIYAKIIIQTWYDPYRFLVGILILGVLGNFSYLWFQKINWFFDLLLTGILGFFIEVALCMQLIYVLPYYISLTLNGPADWVLAGIGILILGTILNMSHRLIKSELEAQLKQGFQGFQAGM